ncbi:MAG: Vitamin B12 transporter BtuB [Flavobacteriales bacterium]|nr:Vitamin B12 transporter BtuB [Flavobacteriales bacterium]
MRFLLLFFLANSTMFGQTTGNIKGRIMSELSGVAFVNIGFSGTYIGTSSNEQGYFKMDNLPSGKHTLQASAIGYKNIKKTIEIKPNETISIQLELEKMEHQLNEVVITGTLNEVSLIESVVPIEVFTPVFFRKNPTPALFEALQIVNGVRPQINCSVCNTGDVHINGMEGPYTMITIDGMPIVGGLASVYGLNGIPNSMIEQLEIVKGPASTLYGSEAVGGLINVITKTPEKNPDFSFDVFTTSWLEVNTDVSTKFSVKNATSILGINYFNYANPIDNNGDNFTDATLQDRIALFNKWSFKRKENREASVALRYIYEDRWGGEMQWKPKFRGGDSIYGESIYTSRYELVGKYQLPTKENIFSSFSYSNHNQNSVYGNVPYLAQQNIAFGQVYWDKKVNELHRLTIGTALRYNYYDDNSVATQTSDTLNPTNKPEHFWLPGLFAQDEFYLNEKNKLLIGIRLDHDSRHGYITTPRLNYKWSPTEYQHVRVSLGTGYRVVNLFTEDHAAVTGARTVELKNKLNPEKSYNGNIGYQKFINTNFGFINVDAIVFYTYFNNKIIPDYETNPDKIIYDNLDGYAVSQGMSFNASFDFKSPIKISLGATVLDVYQMNRNEFGVLKRNTQLLTEKISGTFGVSYKFLKSNIKIDYSGNLYGPMKLPLVENDFRPAYSPWYSIQNIQITKTFNKGWEIYGGIKNLLNFTPPKYSILRANDPFDKNVNSPNNPNGYTFDPTYVYASNQGIRAFIGVRYQFFK